MATTEIIKSGREPKVDAAMIAKAQAFVAGGWTKYNKSVPTIEGLAKHLGLYRTYLYKCQDLADTVEQISTLQSSILIEKGLLNEYNPSIVKLLLSSKHGYVEKTEVSNTHELVNSEPSQAIAGDFAEFTKQKTQAIEAQTVDKQA